MCFHHFSHEFLLKIPVTISPCSVTPNQTWIGDWGSIQVAKVQVYLFPPFG
jgi:hypothetical protein